MLRPRLLVCSSARPSCRSGPSSTLLQHARPMPLFMRVSSSAMPGSSGFSRTQDAGFAVSNYYVLQALPCVQRLEMTHSSVCRACLHCLHTVPPRQSHSDAAIVPRLPRVQGSLVPSHLCPSLSGQRCVPLLDEEKWELVEAWAHRTAPSILPWTGEEQLLGPRLDRLSPRRLSRLSRPPSAHGPIAMHLRHWLLDPPSGLWPLPLVPGPWPTAPRRRRRRRAGEQDLSVPPRYIRS